jgi:ABC-type transport system involved in multi-copper enzyme maturation permease subunit
MSRTRVLAIVRKEFRDYRRNPYMLWTTSLIPLVFLAQPLIYILRVPSVASLSLHHTHELLYLLGIPVLVPSIIAASSIVTERAQGTLEPILTTPIPREEFLLAKALAPMVPAVTISYAVYGIFVLAIEVLAHPGIASALLQGPLVLAQVVFTPFLALWSIWVGIAISTRTSDVRAAQQLSVLGSLPLIAVTSLIAFNVIHPTLRLAVVLGVGLLVIDRLGWRVVSAMFDRERLISGTR